MKCWKCNHDMTYKQIEVLNFFGNSIKVMEKVMADVCDNCGEKVYHANEFKRLQALAKNYPLDKNKTLP